MKLIHLGDLHIGKIVNGFNMLDDQRFALEQIILLAEEHRIEALIIAGDIYDKSDPTAEAVSLFNWFLEELTKRSIKVLAVPGNHDSAERIAYAQGILAKQGVFFPPVFQGSVEHVELKDDHGPVHFWLLPFLKPANMRKYFPEEKIEQDYTKAIRLALGTCDLEEGERNVLIAHQFVTASGSETVREESELVLGGVDNVDASVFSQFDYVALGHVHRPQQLGRSTIRYSGSLLKYSFSEARYPKSAVLVEIADKAASAGARAANDTGAEAAGSKDADAGTTRSGDCTGADAGTDAGAGECVSVTKLPYPVLHDMREIKGPLEKLTSSEVADSAQANDYLHVTLTDGLVLNAMARLRAVYPNVMQLDYEEESEGSETADSQEGLDMQKVDPIDLFESFFEEQTGKALNESQHVIACKELRSALERADEGREEN